MFGLQSFVSGLFGKTVAMSTVSAQVIRGLVKKGDQRKLINANEEARSQNPELQHNTVSFGERSSQNRLESNTLNENSGLQQDNHPTTESTLHYVGSVFNGETRPADFNSVFTLCQIPTPEVLVETISTQPHIFPKRTSAPPVLSRQITDTFQHLKNLKHQLKTCWSSPLFKEVEKNNPIPNEIAVQPNEISESSSFSFQSKPANIIETTWKTIPATAKYVSTGLGGYYLANGGNGRNDGNSGNGGDEGSSAGSGFPKGFLRKIQKPQITDETGEKGTTSIILPSSIPSPYTNLVNNLSAESLLIILLGLAFLKTRPFLIRLGTDFYNGGFTLIGDSYSALRAFLIDLYAGSRFILKEVYEFLKLPFGFFRLLFYVSSIIGLLLALTTVTSGIKPNITSVPAVSAQSENTTKTEKVSGVKGKQLRTITITVFCTLVLVRLAKTPVFTNKIQVVTKVEADKVKDTDGE